MTSRDKRGLAILITLLVALIIALVIMTKPKTSRVQSFEDSAIVKQRMLNLKKSK